MLILNLILNYWKYCKIVRDLKVLRPCKGKKSAFHSVQGWTVVTNIQVQTTIQGETRWIFWLSG